MAQWSRKLYAELFDKVAFFNSRVALVCGRDFVRYNQKTQNRAYSVCPDRRNLPSPMPPEPVGAYGGAATRRPMKLQSKTLTRAVAHGTIHTSVVGVERREEGARQRDRHALGRLGSGRMSKVTRPTALQASGQRVGSS